LFYKLTDDKGMSVKVFHIISHFLGENCTGLCTDEAQSLSGRNAGLQALIRKNGSPSYFLDTLYPTYAFASINNQGLRTDFRLLTMSKRVQCKEDILQSHTFICRYGGKTYGSPLPL
jgi:hypothetical protein